jgi:hypothetical protein
LFDVNSSLIYTLRQRQKVVGPRAVAVGLHELHSMPVLARAAKICELKTHVTPAEAQAAVAELDDMVARTREQRLVAPAAHAAG